MENLTILTLIGLIVGGTLIGNGITMIIFGIIGYLTRPK